MKISIVIPTLNEEEAIGDVVRAVPQDKVVEIVVVDNGSTDDSANQASLAGARVVREPRRGYGYACLAGAKAVKDTDVIVFLDGDRSDNPEQLEKIASPVLDKRADLVIGSRIKGKLDKGSMPFHGRLGNQFIVFLLRMLYGVKISDIGSFRAIRAQSLFDLNMEQMTYGWPVEMVVKAACKGFQIQSVPIHYRKRLGESKVSGTLKGTILATYYMFLVPLKYLFKA